MVRNDEVSRYRTVDEKVYLLLQSEYDTLVGVAEHKKLATAAQGPEKVQKPQIACLHEDRTTCV